MGKFTFTKSQYEKIAGNIDKLYAIETLIYHNIIDIDDSEDNKRFSGKDILQESKRILDEVFCNEAGF